MFKNYDIPVIKFSKLGMGNPEYIITRAVLAGLLGPLRFAFSLGWALTLIITLISGGLLLMSLDPASWWNNDTLGMGTMLITAFIWAIIGVFEPYIQVITKDIPWIYRYDHFWKRLICAIGMYYLYSIIISMRWFIE